MREVGWILKSGLNVDTVDYDGRTPLMIASESGPHLLIIWFFLICRKVRVCEVFSLTWNQFGHYRSLGIFCHRLCETPRPHAHRGIPHIANFERWIAWNSEQRNFKGSMFILFFSNFYFLIARFLSLNLFHQIRSMRVFSRIARRGNYAWLRPEAILLRLNTCY